MQKRISKAGGGPDLFQRDFPDQRHAFFSNGPRAFAWRQTPNRHHRMASPQELGEFRTWSGMLSRSFGATCVREIGGGILTWVAGDDRRFPASSKPGKARRFFRVRARGSCRCRSRRSGHVRLFVFLAEQTSEVGLAELVGGILNFKRPPQARQDGFFDSVKSFLGSLVLMPRSEAASAIFRSAVINSGEPNSKAVAI